MNLSKKDVDFVVKQASNYNFDNLVRVLVLETDPKTMRRHLQQIYFEIVEYVGRENDISFILDSLYHLQLMIQAVERMSEPDAKHLEIKAV